MEHVVEFISDASSDLAKLSVKEWPLGPTSEFYKIVPKDIEENIEFRSKILVAAQSEDIQSELRIICSRDACFYINVFGWTLNGKDYPECPKRPMVTYPFQDQAILDIIEAIGHYDIAVPKSRDMGASWMCLLAMEWLWHFRPSMQFLLTSQDESLVDGKSEKALFRKLDFWWEHLPGWLKPQMDRTSKACRNLANESSFTGQATVPNLARGDRPTAILLDEAAEMAKAPQIASSTSGATNCRIFNSTPNGRFGTGKEFYQRVRNPATVKVWVHWSQHPEKAVGLYKLKRRVLDPGSTEFVKGEWISEREIYKSRQDGLIVKVSEPQRLMLDWKTYDWKKDYDFDRLKFRDGEAPRSEWFDRDCARDPNPKIIAKEKQLDFEGSTEKLSQGVDMETLRNTMCRRPLYTGEVLPSEESFQEGLESLRPVWLAGAGYLEVWCDLPDGRPPPGTYSIGIDVAGGTGGSSSSQSVMSVWDNVSGEQVAEWRSNNVSPDDLAIRAVVLAKWFHNALLIPEVNAAGGIRFKNKVVACGYWNMYRRIRSEIEVFETSTSKLGWHSTKGPEILLRGLFAGFVSGDAKPRSQVLLEQCEEYEWSNNVLIHKASAFSDNQSDGGAPHGDAAVAAGLAWLGVETAKQLASEKKPKPAEEVEYPEGSIGARREQRKRDQERTSEEFVECIF